MTRHVTMALLATAVTAGCAPQPMTRATAARLCADEARLADGVAGTVGVGFGSDGGSARGTIVVTSDVLAPRAEADVLETCIARRMASGDRGPAPRRPGLTIGLEGSLNGDL